MSAVTVAIVGSRTEAELMAGMLRSHGIKAAVSVDDAGGWEPQLQTGSGVKVLVPAADAGHARKTDRRRGGAPGTAQLVPTTDGAPAGRPIERLNVEG